VPLTDGELSCLQHLTQAAYIWSWSISLNNLRLTDYSRLGANYFTSRFAILKRLKNPRMGIILSSFDAAREQISWGQGVGRVWSVRFYPFSEGFKDLFSRFLTNQDQLSCWSMAKTRDSSRMLVSIDNH
jgi:hypothetical protein